MKHYLNVRNAARACFVAAAVANATAQTAGTAFSDQGQLDQSGNPAAGKHDLVFRLFSVETGGVQVGADVCINDVDLVNGRFTVSLDFGAAFAANTQRYLAIEVRPDADGTLACGNASGFALLSPRQPVMPAPQSLFAVNAESAANANTLDGQTESFYLKPANLAGTLADARLSSNIFRLNVSQTVTGPTLMTSSSNSFAGNGSALTALNAGN